MSKILVGVVRDFRRYDHHFVLNKKRVSQLQYSVGGTRNWSFLIKLVAAFFLVAMFWLIFTSLGGNGNRKEPPDIQLDVVCSNGIWRGDDEAEAIEHRCVGGT